MKGELFNKLKQADQEDLKYMLLLAEARKLTCQIEANVNATISSPAQQQMGASVIGNGSLQRGSITDNYLTSVVK